MPFCHQCGADNPDSARYCDQCGAALIPASPPPAPVPTPAVTGATLVAGPSTCAQCGVSVIPGEAFCDNCGAPLNAPAPPTAQVPEPPSGIGLSPQPTYPPPQPAPVAVPPPVSQQSTAPQPTVPAPPSYHSPAPTPAPVAPPPMAPVAPPQRMMLAPAKLLIVSSGVELPLPTNHQAIVGRADPVSHFFPDIDLAAHKALEFGVGRRHAQIHIQNGQIVLEDLDSTNGTFLNGQKLSAHQPQVLNHEDQIQFGQLIVRVYL
ncbi:MAG: FHA domain-containing protein [Chloroflexi bacterium AL-W]|nr:FHA domain-containing protein [Chloroflexi bacterium AL-N1]NOK70278.1 FHA domain-containing protein [Chloroflexi bacterium AL-N10]NOK77815.1 FHA domain-containing protein [Chloroflexi bacterium AL-N5]NOK84824.1 FHA domain-containing protein [Chloroflexi bacterium AL-W]NOK92431.1 FHA domain-containing protein [Chloroflexi bacterium AL-N15]